MKSRREETAQLRSFGHEIRKLNHKESRGGDFRFAGVTTYNRALRDRNAERVKGKKKHGEIQ